MYLMNRKRKHSRLARKNNVSQNVHYRNVGGKLGINYYLQTDVGKRKENRLYVKLNAKKVNSRKGPAKTVTPQTEKLKSPRRVAIHIIRKK